MKRKLASFFMKMRDEVIPVFLCNEKMEVEEFVRTCQETYRRGVVECPHYHLGRGATTADP
jgi:hypothetical protein